MNCHACLEQLDEYSVAVDQASHAKVAAHLRKCGHCREKLAEITEAWSLLSAALDPIEPSEKLESKLVAHVDDESLVTKAPLVGRAPPYVPYLVAASVLLIATAGLYFTWYRTPDVSVVDQIDKQLRRLEEIQDRFGNPDVIYVALRDVNRQSMAACAIFDPMASQLHFFAMELQPPTKSACYKLWLLRDDDVVASAVLDLNVEGVASAVLDLENGVEIVEALITLESDSQADSPQGGVCLRTTIDFVGMDTNQ